MDKNWLLRPLRPDDYDAMLALWQACDGIGLRGADSRESMHRFLKRQAGLCFAVEGQGVLLGTVLASEDGRRGYLYHLAVHPDVRRQGLGRLLVEQALNALRERGIGKCHIHVFRDNLHGQVFWQSLGWRIRDETLVMSALLTDDANA